MNEKCINSIWLTKSRRGFKIKRTNAWSKTWFEFYWTKKTGKISGTLRKSLWGSARALTGLVVKYIKIRAEELCAPRVSAPHVCLRRSWFTSGPQLWESKPQGLQGKWDLCPLCGMQVPRKIFGPGCWGKTLINADLTQNKWIHLYLEERQGDICECQRMITNAASNAPGIIQGPLNHWKNDAKRRVQCSVLFVPIVM